MFWRTVVPSTSGEKTIFTSSVTKRLPKDMGHNPIILQSSQDRHLGQTWKKPASHQHCISGQNFYTSECDHWCKSQCREHTGIDTSERSATATLALSSRGFQTYTLHFLHSQDFTPRKNSCNDLWYETLVLITRHCYNWIFPAYYVWPHKDFIQSLKVSPSYLLINKLCQLQYSLLFLRIQQNWKTLVQKSTA